MENREITTIVFDIGGTLVKMDGQYPGKMKDWPELAAMPGAVEAMSDLSTRYQIIAATNAQDSTAADVIEAMQRIGLGKVIRQCYTYRELNAKKPEPAFYTNLCSTLNKTPGEVVMVGDDYQRDILPAAQVGMHTVWFNPDNQVAAAHLPLQERECFSLSELPAILRRAALPDYPTCLYWYMQHGATHTLLAHVNMVAAASYQLAVWLKEAGIKVSPLLAHRGGLLHDLAKLEEDDADNHAVLAAKLLDNLGQPELAGIAEHHLIGDLTSLALKPVTWEEKVVNYCDKLTEGSELVSLDERLQALKQRYPRFADKIVKNTPLVRNLENEILTPIGLSPNELLSRLKQILFNGYKAK
jgi:putative hydrolase of the HAD superfamily